jgi:thymidylate synthase
MNTLDLVYQDLLQTIIDNGVEKKDRTGTGTKSIFGYQIRHDMQSGFPLLTTKKMFWKGIVTELLWFLRGDTNIKYLVDNDCHIWDGDAYKAYLKKYEKDKLHGVIYENNETQNRPFSKEEFINWIKNNDKFSELYGELGPVYGKQWRSWHWRSEPVLPEEKYMIYTTEGKPVTWSDEKYIDQIQNLINDLKTNPDSRRLMVSAWNVGELDQMVLPPCHYGFQVYTRELSLEERYVMYFEKLDHTMVPLDIKIPNIHQYFTELNIPTRAISLMWNQRSVDTFLGLPFNIASYGLLLEIIAKAVNMVPDQLIGNLGDVHLYNNHIEQAKEQISRTPYKLPKLNINTEFWPYEGGECGEGPLDATAVFNSFKDDSFCKCLLEEDIQLGNYQSHPAIKAPLSN